jgi:hypothetical protein
MVASLALVFTNTARGADGAHRRGAISGANALLFRGPLLADVVDLFGDCGRFAAGESRAVVPAGRLARKVLPSLSEHGNWTECGELDKVLSSRLEQYLAALADTRARAFGNLP